jgi:hypothetical protein
MLLGLWAALTGCADAAPAEEEIPESHAAYLENYGWHIKKKIGERTEVVDYYPERMKTMRIAGLDLEPFRHREARITSYELSETQNSEDKDARKMYATIYEIDGTIVGGYGSLEGWTPGLFALDGKDGLIQRGILRP